MHNHPELGMSLHETSAFVASQLSSFGYDVVELRKSTEVIGIWDTGIEGPVFALGADMDSSYYTTNGKYVNDNVCGIDTLIIEFISKNFHTADLILRYIAVW